MNNASDAVHSAGRSENKLYRALRWALLGAASGAVAWIAVWIAESDTFLYYAPGTTFGLVIGLALFGQGYARIWQAASFAVLSVAAWYAGFHAGVEYGYGWASGLYSKYLGLFVIGVVGGTAWAIVQTLAVALLSFARRVRLLAILVAVGAVMAGLLLVAVDVVTVGFSDGALFLILWTSWYAVYAAVLSFFLPWPQLKTCPSSGGRQ